MKGIIDFIKLIIITVVGGLLVVFLQDSVEEIARPTDLHVEALTGPWAPMPLERENKEFDASAQKDLIKENNSFARIFLRNESNTTLKSIRFVYNDKWFTPSVLVFKEEGGISRFYFDARSIDLPDLKPGEGLYIAFWNQFGFGWPSFLDSVEIYTELGKVEINVQSHVDENGYNHEHKDTSFFGLFLIYWKEILLIFAVMGIILSIISEYIAQKYYKKLILDDDFWISERQRMDEAGIDKFRPNLKDIV